MRKRKSGQIIFYVNDTTDFNLIDWKRTEKEYEMTKDEILNDPELKSNHIGELMFKLLDNKMGFLDEWGVMEIIYTEKELKNNKKGKYKLNYKIIFDGNEEQFENPFHLIGIEGYSNCSWL